MAVTRNTGMWFLCGRFHEMMEGRVDAWEETLAHLRVLRQQIPRNWNFPVSFLLRRRKNMSLVPARGEVCLPECLARASRAYRMMGGTTP